MKNLALILTVIFSTFSLNALSTNKDNKSSHNTNTPYSIKVDHGIETKVYINKDETTGEPVTRTVYKNDIDGKRLGSTIYRWDSSVGWILNTKTDYIYNTSKQLVKIVKSEWNNEKSEWGAKIGRNL